MLTERVTGGRVLASSFRQRSVFAFGSARRLGVWDDTPLRCRGDFPLLTPEAPHLHLPGLPGAAPAVKKYVSPPGFVCSRREGPPLLSPTRGSPRPSYAFSFESSTQTKRRSCRFPEHFLSALGFCFPHVLELWLRVLQNFPVVLWSTSRAGAVLCGQSGG